MFFDSLGLLLIRCSSPVFSLLSFEVEVDVILVELRAFFLGAYKFQYVLAVGILCPSGFQAKFPLPDGLPGLQVCFC